MLVVTVRYFAAARAAAGVEQEQVTLSGAADLGAVLDAVVRRHGAALHDVLRRCSFLLDEVATHGTDTPVADGQAVDVLPPFAGG